MTSLRIILITWLCNNYCAEPQKSMWHNITTLYDYKCVCCVSVSVHACRLIVMVIPKYLADDTCLIIVLYML